MVSLFQGLFPGTNRGSNALAAGAETVPRANFSTQRSISDCSFVSDARRLAPGHELAGTKQWL